MAKKSKARLVTASEEVARLVDQGYETDVDLKNLTFKDKGIKKVLTDRLEGQFEEGPTIRVEGEQGAAVISQTEKFAINGEAEDVATVRDAAEKGLLGDAVKVEQVINVPVADRERAASILQAAGINATTSVSLAIDPEELRIMRSSQTASVEEIEAEKALEKVTERKVSYRVKFEKA